MTRHDDLVLGDETKITRARGQGKRIPWQWLSRSITAVLALAFVFSFVVLFRPLVMDVDIMDVPPPWF